MPVAEPGHGESESDLDSGVAGATNPARRALKALPCSVPVLVVIGTLGVAASVGLGVFIASSNGSSGHAGAAPAAPLAPAAVPGGVNFGGWLVLEDWFFSGAYGRNVMSRLQSKTGPGQGLCLPPLLLGSEEPWASEGLLTKRLEAAHGAEEAVRIFTAHRHDYIGVSDLREAADLGIRTVRLPLPWTTFADALAPIDAKIYAGSSAARLVPDPFYSDEVSFVTVDRQWLAQVLRQASHYNLRMLLDVHMMPGGSSDGTYNGVWPLRPRFWNANSTLGNRNVTLAEAGLWIAAALTKWVEALDTEAFRAVAGITFLNEPAHMASSAQRKGEPFIRDELQVTTWIEHAASIFRKSTLPQRGVRLYVNLIETTFANFWATIPSWWRNVFTAEERHNWAVLDMHWYTAWSGGICSGRVVPGGKYFCDQPLDEVRAFLRQCQEYDSPGRLGRAVDGLKACTEFSLGTYEDALLACNDPDMLHMFLAEQVEVFAANGVEPYFWTWRMPYGPTFERGWSLKYIAGLERLAPPHRCERYGNNSLAEP